MSWLVEQFFYETIGLSYLDILSAFERSAPPTQMVSLQEVIERRIHKVRSFCLRKRLYQRSYAQLMVPHIRSSWFNPPRRRRHLMKEVLQWHMLYDVMLNDVAAHAPPVRRARSVSAVNCLVCFAGCAICSHFARGPARSEAVATEYVPRGHPFRISAGALRSRREANRVLALILRPRCTLGVYRGFTPCDPVW